MWIFCFGQYKLNVVCYDQIVSGIRSIVEDQNLSSGNEVVSNQEGQPAVRGISFFFSLFSRK